MWRRGKTNKAQITAFSEATNKTLPARGLTLARQGEKAGIKDACLCVYFQGFRDDDGDATFTII